MTLKKVMQLVGVALATFVCGVFVLAQGQGLVRVVIQTEFGNIEADIDTRRAPITAANFLKYVDEGYWADARFHRTVKLDGDQRPNNDVKIEVVQASLNPEKADKQFPPIPLERTNQTGILHKNGTLSMARGMPDTARASFSIVINDQPSMDFGGKRNPDGQGFAAFGQVVSGMDVAKKIQVAPAEGQNLTPPIRILNIRRK